MTAAQDAGALEAMDAWCVRKLDALMTQMHPYIMAGGSTEDPQYRTQLGQHQAFMRMRSFIHGARRAHPRSHP